MSVFTGTDVSLIAVSFTPLARPTSWVDSDSPTHTEGIAAGIPHTTFPIAPAVLLTSNHPINVFAGTYDFSRLLSADGALRAIVML